MRTDVDSERTATLALLRRTRHATRTLLGGLDPELVVHDDERAWRVRDVVGHLGIWNGEAARSLEAHASGGGYTCIESDTLYDEYNGAAVEAMPADRWDVPARYPWAEWAPSLGSSCS